MLVAVMATVQSSACELLRVDSKCINWIISCVLKVDVLNKNPITLESALRLITHVFGSHLLFLLSCKE